MLACKRDTLRRARHRPIVVSQLAQYTCRFKTGQRHQIDGRLRMTAARQHAARLSAQWENVPRTVKIGRFCAILNCRTHRSDTVSGGNAGGHAFCGFNGHGKTGAVGAGVVFHHHWQVELLTTVFSNTQANNTATVTNG
ncbi:Uncharacterised protein [Salmonella enterica subsp. enterica serovar Bovismorbificans]|nr:Uncharacterised protein [Salmonella enterica subsp. enterica serovar Bovismorbificans]CNT84719.1 Uncharacterised protein [Salmonella enterica subsp. enterica serovar Bovismorbificans]CNT86749.1 Uncharacterised protein [Salmonella enterica subsp. enterica serovar Bovismorbificans]CNU05228.1 Uncharacterised protein [Salmonella enterica subsp. enterica serovar Bovismorbificans]CNU23681.1 Uncharacterised protein [Salmonella enterica subsp. enterica serovar Bovismorbificans]